jgi:hypothetical protein
MYDLSLFFILLVFKSLVNQNLSAATPRNYSCSHFSVENYFFGARILWELFIPLKGIAIYQALASGINQIK